MKNKSVLLIVTDRSQCQEIISKISISRDIQARPKHILCIKVKFQTIVARVVNLQVYLLNRSRALTCSPRKCISFISAAS